MRWPATALVLLSGCSSCQKKETPAPVEASIADSAPVMDAAAAEGATADAPAREVRPSLRGRAGPCLIAGYFPYEDFEKAKALADRIRADDLAAKGADDDTVDVYDTRDFDDLPWSQLVVIAGHDADTQAPLDAALKKLAPSVPKAFIVHCSPSLAYTMRTASDVHAQIVPDEPVLNDFSKDQNPECFGWSAKERAVACIDGVWKNGAGHYEVVFPGSQHAAIPIADWSSDPAPVCGTLPPCLKPTAAARAAIEATLKTGGYVEIKTRRNELHVDKPAMFARPAVTFKMPRANAIVVECAANGTKKTILDEPAGPEKAPGEAEENHRLDVHVRVTPDPTRLLISYDYERHASGVDVEIARSILFDPDTDCNP